MGDYGVKSQAVINKHQAYLVPLTDVQMGEGDVEYMGDSIVCTPVWVVSKLQGIKEAG